MTTGHDILANLLKELGDSGMKIMTILEKNIYVNGDSP